MKWTFRNLVALISILGIFILIGLMGAGILVFEQEIIQGVIIGGLMQWVSWIYMFYFRKKGTEEATETETGKTK